MMKRITALLLLACLVLSGLSNAKTAYADDSWYTYTYNYWGDEEASPDAYTVDRVISGSAFGEDVGSLLNPDSLFAIDDLLYVVDHVPECLPYFLGYASEYAVESVP